MDLEIKFESLKMELFPVCFLRWYYAPFNFRISSAKIVYRFYLFNNTLVIQNVFEKLRLYTNLFLS